MRIILTLKDSEGNRQIEDEEENIRPAYQEIRREIENVCCKHQIRYEDILIEDEGR